MAFRSASTPPFVAPPVQGTHTPVNPGLPPVAHGTAQRTHVAAMNGLEAVLTPVDAQTEKVDSAKFFLYANKHVNRAGQVVNDPTHPKRSGPIPFSATYNGTKCPLKKSDYDNLSRQAATIIFNEYDKKMRSYEQVVQRLNDPTLNLTSKQREKLTERRDQLKSVLECFFKEGLDGTNIKKYSIGKKTSRGNMTEKYGHYYLRIQTRDGRKISIELDADEVRRAPGANLNVKVSEFVSLVSTKVEEALEKDDVFAEAAHHDRNFDPMPNPMGIPNPGPSYFNKKKSRGTPPAPVRPLPLSPQHSPHLGTSHSSAADAQRHFNERQYQQRMNQMMHSPY